MCTRMSTNCYLNVFSAGLIFMNITNSEVTEGNAVNVCVNLICSDGVLECPLEVKLNATNGEAGKPMICTIPFYP